MEKIESNSQAEVTGVKIGWQVLEVGGSVVATKHEMQAAMQAMEDGVEPFAIKFMDIFAQIISVGNVESGRAFGIEYDEQRVSSHRFLHTCGAVQKYSWLFCARKLYT